MMQSDKILDKIKKLLEHSESARAIGSEAEAEVFAEKASKLLLEHHLSMDDVELAAMRRDQPFDETRVDPLRKGKRTGWLERLASIVAYWHMCGILVTAKTSAIHFVGRLDNRQVASEVFLQLSLFAEFESRRQYNNYASRCSKSGKKGAAKGFRESWLVGFIETVDKRLKKAHEQVVREKESSRALIVVEDELIAVKRYINEKYSHAQFAAGPKNRNMQGFSAGMETGKSVSIRGNNRTIT